MTYNSVFSDICNMMVVQVVKGASSCQMEVSNSLVSDSQAHKIKLTGLFFSADTDIMSRASGGLTAKSPARPHHVAST